MTSHRINHHPHRAPAVSPTRDRARLVWWWLAIATGCTLLVFVACMAALLVSATVTTVF